MNKYRIYYVLPIIDTFVTYAKTEDEAVEFFRKNYSYNYEINEVVEITNE